MTQTSSVDQPRRGVNRRTVLRGAGGATLGGFLAATLRLGNLSASAQDATPAAGDALYPEATYIGADYSFTGPAELPGGLNQITLVNEGMMDHHAIFFKLNDGVTAADLPAALEQGLGGLFAIGAAVGGPGSISGGQTSTVIMDLAEGNYLLLCLIPDDSDGIPHAAKGMVYPVSAGSPAAAAQPAPEATATIEMMDFHFMGLPNPAPAGRNVWAVTNTGQQLHELVIYQMAPGVTFELVQTIFLVPPAASPEAEATAEMGEMEGMAEGTPPAAGPPPFTAVTGWAPANPATSGWIVADLAPGDYFAICFIPDPDSGAPHFALGMLEGFSVA